jgi:hypothetical protein
MLRPQTSWLLICALTVSGAGTIVACVLNPQPLPPDTADSGPGAPGSAVTGKDSGRAADAGDAEDVDVGFEAGGGGEPDADAGDAASDAPDADGSPDDDASDAKAD